MNRASEQIWFLLEARPAPWSTNLSPSSVKLTQPACSFSGEHTPAQGYSNSKKLWFCRSLVCLYPKWLTCLERILIGETQLDQQLRCIPLEATRTGFGFCGTLETKAEDGHKCKLVDEPRGTEIWGTGCGFWLWLQELSFLWVPTCFSVFHSAQGDWEESERRSQGVPTMKVKEENGSFKIISVAATWIIRKGEVIELHKFWMESFGDQIRQGRGLTSQTHSLPDRKIGLLIRK